MTSTLTPRPGGTATLGSHTVARIGFGTMQLERRPNAATDVLRRATSLGVDHLDTAEFYGAGQVNRLVGAFRASYDGDLVIATKVGAVHTGDTIAPAQRPAQLREQVEANLTSLGLDRLDLVNLRRMDAAPGLIAAGEDAVDLEDQLAELVELRAEGKVAAIGLSNVDAAQLERALPASVACVQNAYSALDRTSEPVHELCRTHEIAWVPFFPLGSAFDRLPKVNEDPRVVAEATRLGVTPSQIGLAWLLADDPHCLLIPGTSSVDHLVENLATGDVVLDDRALEVLGSLA